MQPQNSSGYISLCETYRETANVGGSVHVILLSEVRAWLPCVHWISIRAEISNGELRMVERVLSIELLESIPVGTVSSEGESCIVS